MSAVGARARAAAALLVLLATGNGGAAPRREDVDRALEVASELERERAFDAARRQLEAVAEHTSASEAEALRSRACLQHALAGDPAAGRRCALGLRPASRAGQAEARYLAASMLHELGDLEGASREARAVVAELPETAGAVRALVLARGVARAGGDARAEVELLLGLAELPLAGPGGGGARATRELTASLWVEAGRTALELGQAAWAVTILGDGAPAAAGTSWADDALIWAARALREEGRLAEAVRLYSAIREDRIEWPLGASENSVYHDDALLELAQTLFVMGRAEAAVEAAEELGEEAPSSRLRDDAEFLAARLRAARGEREALERFLREYPDSPYAAEGRRLLEGP